MNEEDKKILQHAGWSVDCESPFELRHCEGSYATGQAASLVLLDVRSEHEEFERQNKLSVQLATYYSGGLNNSGPCGCMGYDSCSDPGCPAWWNGFLQDMTKEKLVEMVKKYHAE